MGYKREKRVIKRKKPDRTHTACELTAVNSAGFFGGWLGITPLVYPPRILRGAVSEGLEMRGSRPQSAVSAVVSWHRARLAWPSRALRGDLICARRHRGWHGLRCVRCGLRSLTAWPAPASSSAVAAAARPSAPDEHWQSHGHEPMPVHPGTDQTGGRAHDSQLHVSDSELCIRHEDTS